MSGVCMATTGLCGLLLVGVAHKVWQVLVSMWGMMIKPCTDSTVAKLGLYGLLLAVAVWLVWRKSRKNSDAAEPKPEKKSPRERPSPERRLPPPKLGKHVTVLSIDGGGIRGLIPAVLLAALEEELKQLDGPDARIADYFDVIAGTSTGGLTAAMLTTPDDTTGRPKFAAGQIVEYYRASGSRIFSPRGLAWGWLHFVRSLFCGPRYDCTSLHQEINDITGGNTLADTLTNIVVPTFDVRRLNTIDFSSFPPPGDTPGEIHLLSDVCIGTTAAPTYFPEHHFFQDSTDAKKRSDFHLIDGGVGANNPTMVAISRVAREVLCGNDYFKNEMDYGKLIVISIGTGSTRKRAVGRDEGMMYTAKRCAEWGAIGWIINWGRKPWILDRKPIIDMLMHATDFLVDQNVAMFLWSHGCQRYLRIQALQVDERNFSLDDTTEENMARLVGIGNALLEEQVCKVNQVTGRYEEDDSGPRSNRDELRTYAQILKQERDFRRGIVHDIELQ